MVILVKEKHQTNNYFIQVKSPLSFIELSNTVTFLRNALFYVILTSVTIVEHVIQL